MNIPKSDRKKALIIVDVQPVFLTKENKYVLKNITELLNTTSYDLYVNAVFYADEKSIWKKQTNWTVSKDQAVTEKGIQDILDTKRNVLNVVKQTKSVFKGEVVPSVTLGSWHATVQNMIVRNGMGDTWREIDKIEEVHIIGLDTNDCVLATAYEAFDMGFFTYVIEECVQSSSGNDIHEKGLALLRHVELTNNE